MSQRSQRAQRRALRVLIIRKDRIVFRTLVVSLVLLSSVLYGLLQDARKMSMMEEEGLENQAGPALGARKVTGPLAPLFQVQTREKAMAFAVNVAWGEEHLPEMLRILRDEDVKATFFFVGTWVEMFPDLARRIANAGHEVANHGYEHVHPAGLSSEALKDVILKNETLIQSVTGRKTKLFSPPYGEFNAKVIGAADDLGYRTVMWTIDTVDWNSPPPEEVYRKVVGDASPGAIVLIHPTEPTVKALPGIIRDLKVKGYKFATISELVAGSEKTPDHSVSLQ